jgi:hypothetical protein
VTNVERKVKSVIKVNRLNFQLINNKNSQLSMILTTELIPINLINRYHFDNGKSDSEMICTPIVEIFI